MQPRVPIWLENDKPWAIQHKIIVRRLAENVKPAVSVTDKETIVKPVDGVAEKRAAGKPVLDKNTEGKEKPEEGFVKSGVNSTEGQLRSKVVQTQTQLSSTIQQGGISTPPGAKQKEEYINEELDKQWAALTGPALDLEGVNAATALIYSALEAEACARRRLSAPRKIIVRRQAEAAKPAEDAADQKVAATPEGDKKTEGAEELDERFWSNGIRRPVVSQTQTQLTSTSVQSSGFGRPLGGSFGGVNGAFAQPGLAQTGFGQTGFGQTGFAQPGLGQTGLVQPGLGQTGFGQTGLGQTGFGQTGFGQTGFGQTGFGQTGLGQSGFGQPVGFQPGSGFGGANVDFTNVGPNGRPALSFQQPGFSINLREKEKGGNKEAEKPKSK